MNFSKHLIQTNCTIKKALELLGIVGLDTVLFAVNDRGELKGSISDGDIRRAILKGASMEDSILEVTNSAPKFIRKDRFSIEEIKELRNDNFKLIPVVDAQHVIVNIINFRSVSSFLPIDVVVMAGGLGSRLKPLTKDTPKPLLKIGGKSIIDYSVDRLISFGVDNFWISVRYLADQIKAHFESSKRDSVQINFVLEDVPLGTIGAVSKITDFKHDYVLVTNSDILTNLNYERFFEDFIQRDADMSVVTIPYEVKIPYAVMETKESQVLSFKEKPTYTYYSNGGIYLIKKSILGHIPKQEFYNSTDLMELVLEKGLKLISYPVRSYWLDIGKHEDYQKAQNDVKHIQF